MDILMGWSIYNVFLVLLLDIGVMINIYVKILIKYI